MIQYIIIFLGLYFLINLIKIKKPIIISVDGNIGSGKSTFIKILKNKFKNNNNIIFLQEPVDTWINIKDNEDNNILNKFYENKNRWSYTFQNFAFITRTMLLNKLINNNNVSIFSKRKVIISERSTETDKNVFAKMLYDDKSISQLEYKIYKYWYKHLYSHQIHNIIYIRTEPGKSYQRILKRSRDEEVTITESYIKSVHDYHDTWLCNHGNYNLCVLDGNQEFENNNENCDKLIKKVNTFLNNLEL